MADYGRRSAKFAYPRIFPQTMKTGIHEFVRYIIDIISK